MPFVYFRKKFRCFSFDFHQNFDVRTFPWWLSIRGTKFFLRDIQNIFFFKIFPLVLSDRFLDGFSKFRFFIGEICILIHACVSLSCWYKVFLPNHTSSTERVRSALWSTHAVSVVSPDGLPPAGHLHRSQSEKITCHREARWMWIKHLILWFTFTHPS